MKRIFSAFTFLLILNLSQAQTFTALNGPFGANVSNMFFDATKSKIYVVANSKLFVSTDNAVNWTQIPLPLGGYLTDAVLDGTKLVILMGNQIQSSLDNGVTWTVVNPSVSNTDALRKLVKLPGAGRFAIRADQSLLISVDNGTSWKSWLTHNFDDIADFDFTSNGDIYISDVTIGIRKYAVPANPTDPASWSAANWVTVFPKQAIAKDHNLTIVISPTDKIFMSYFNAGSTALRFQSSADAGLSWQPVSNTGFTLPFLDVPTWSVAPNGKLYLYDNLAGSRTAWEFTEGSPTPWITKPWPTTTVGDQRINIALWKSNTQSFAGATTDGIFTTSNTGASWSIASIGLKFGEGRQVEITADGKIILVQGFNPKVYWYSTVQGVTVVLSL